MRSLWLLTGATASLEYSPDINAWFYEVPTTLEQVLDPLIHLRRPHSVQAPPVQDPAVQDPPVRNVRSGGVSSKRPATASDLAAEDRAPKRPKPLIIPGKNEPKRDKLVSSSANSPNRPARRVSTSANQVPRSYWTPASSQASQAVAKPVQDSIRLVRPGARTRIPIVPVYGTDTRIN